MAAKKTLEQIEAQEAQLRMQLEALAESKKEMATEAADEARAVLDQALEAYNKLALAAGGTKREFILTVKGGTPVGSGRTRRTRGPAKAADYTTDQKNKGIAAVQAAKGKPVGALELSKLTGYNSMMKLFGEEITEGTIKADGQGRNKTYAYVGK